MVRRRFFPSKPVQTVPGQTVQLEVQLRPVAVATATTTTADEPEPCNCDVSYALGWPSEATLWDMGYLDASERILKFSKDGHGSADFMDFGGWAIYLPFQVLNETDGGLVPVPDGYEVTWAAEPGWEAHPLPEMTFDPTTGRGYIYVYGSGSGEDFGLRISLKKDSAEVGHLVLVRADGEGWHAGYPIATWLAWA